MGKKSVILSCLLVLLVGCSPYQKLLKSGDYELKYQKALEYFDNENYSKALSLFEDVSSYYKGTDQAEELLYRVAQCYLKTKDNSQAMDYYKTLVRNYPKGKYAPEAKYMIGYCAYLDSPDARLDQTPTHDAIKALEDFVAAYPADEHVTDAQKQLQELYDKLAYKELLSARLYRNLGTYRGDNYLAATVVVKNAMLKYPGNPYAEEMAFITLQCKYERAKLSTAATLDDRVEETLDEYYSFINDYPDSQFKKEAEKIGNEIKALKEPTTTKKNKKKK